MTFRCASPVGYGPESGSGIGVTDDPRAAAEGADVVYTDVWASMGQEGEAAARRAAFAAYTVDASVMGAANQKAVFLHCLPAHRGEEVAAEVVDGAAEPRVAASREPPARAARTVAVPSRRRRVKLAKPQRQHRIALLLEQKQIASQAHLVELLSAEGVEATQATVSRDLEELGAVKVRVAGGTHGVRLAGVAT